jgi:hypothetical protein
MQKELQPLTASITYRRVNQLDVPKVRVSDVNQQLSCSTNRRFERHHKTLRTYETRHSLNDMPRLTADIESNIPGPKEIAKHRNDRRFDEIALSNQRELFVEIIITPPGSTPLLQSR